MANREFHKTDQGYPLYELADAIAKCQLLQGTK